MISQQTLQGNWNEIKGKLRSQWGALTDDDLTIFNGNVEQFVGMIQRKTGEARESVEHFLAQFSSEGADALSRAGETVRAGAQQVADSMHRTSEKAAELARERYAEVEGLVRERPAESLAVCFGAGVITGVVLSLLLRGR